MYHWDILYFHISYYAVSIFPGTIPMTEVVQIPLDVRRMKSATALSAGWMHIPRITRNPNLWESEDLDSLLRTLLDQRYCFLYAPLEIQPYGLGLDCTDADFCTHDWNRIVLSLMEHEQIITFK
jgi:hypothetical protein